MKFFYLRIGLFQLGIALSLIIASAPGLPAVAQTNAWISSGSGNWQNPDWSLGVLPGAGQDIAITNLGWKAVAIGAATAASYPATMTVKSVTISSPSNFLNTLLLNYAGTRTPLVIGDSSNQGRLALGQGAVVLVLSSALEVHNAVATNDSHSGGFQVAGSFTESDVSDVTAGFLDLTPGGTYNLTNSFLSGGDEFIQGHFNQQGGTNVGNVLLNLDGEYDLFDGALIGSVEVEEPGFFIQYGGSVSGNLGIASGVYELDAGFLSSSNISIGGNFPANYPYGGGFVTQKGGTNIAGDITMELGPGSYSLSGGVVSASSLTIRPFQSRYGAVADNFNQSGGYHTNAQIILAGAVGYGNTIAPASYDLSGGMLETPSMSLSMGAVNQSGGTNIVGTLSLSDASTYTMSNGVLISDHLQLAGLAVFQHAGGSLAGQENITLADGTWSEQTGGESLGQLQLSTGTNSSLMLPSMACVLRFADSSGASWASGSRLTIYNWAAAPSGGGPRQIFFGKNSTGLSPQQLSHVWFSNPSGLSAGTHPAQILADGEVVPKTAGLATPQITAVRQSDGALQLIIGGQAGQRFAVEISTDLQHWSVWTNLWNTNGTTLLMDPGVTNGRARFYRAALP